MLLFHKMPTIKTLQVPVHLLFAEGSNLTLPESPFVDFLQRYRNKDFDVNSHPYVKSVEYACKLAQHGKPDVIRQWVKDTLDHDIETFEKGRFKDPSSKEIPVRIKANGAIEMIDAHHRAAMRFLDGERVLPVGIKHVSPAWLAFERTLIAASGEKILYSPIEHPWFDDWKVIRRGNERERILIDFLREMRSEIPSFVHYDIGCCTGHLCRQLKRAGVAVHGLDNREDHIHIADTLNLVFGLDIPFYRHDDFLQVLVDDSYNSIGSVSCLSVLHHWLNTPGNDERYLAAVQTMAEKAWVVFIDQVNEKQGFVTKATTKIPLNKEEYERWLRNEVGFGSVRYLGTHHWGRPLFACSKKVTFK